MSRRCLVPSSIPGVLGGVVTALALALACTMCPAALADDAPRITRASVPAGGEIAWGADLPLARAQAIRDRRPLLVYFTHDH